jgi:glutathione S-transferase
MPESYTVIGSPKTRAMRVIWMLEELGLDYQIQPEAPRSETVSRWNPSGKIPLLKTGDDVLIDSVAIVTYLADRHNSLTMKAGTVPRAIQDSFTQFCVDEIEGALWTAAKNSFIHPEALRVPEIKRVCKAEFDRAMETLAIRLGDNEYVMGGAFTVPDLLLGHCAGWAQSAKFDLPGGVVGAYFERVRARPALKAAMERAAAAMAA